MNRCDGTEDAPDGGSGHQRVHDEGKRGDVTTRDRRTVLAGAVGVLASASLAGCTIRADTEGIDIDFEDDDGDADDGTDGDEPSDPDAGDVDDGTSPTATPTEPPDGEDGTPTPTGTPTPMPTASPDFLRDSLVNMMITYDDVSSEFGSESANAIAEAASEAEAEGVWGSSEAYISFLEEAYGLQETFAGEVISKVTDSSFGAYEDALLNLAEVLQDDPSGQGAALAQNGLTQAAANLEPA